MGHMFLANVYNDTGRLAEAYDGYRKALQLDPLHATILMNLSQTALKLGLYERAQRYLAHAKALFPTHAYLLGLSAHVYVSSGNQAAARELVRRWQMDTADDAEGRAPSDELACGMIWLFLDQPGEAESCLHQALDSSAPGSLRDRDVMMAKTHLAALEFALGKPERGAALAAEAREIGTEASRISPNDEFLAYEMAVAHALSNNNDAAFNAFARSILLGRRDLGWMENDRRLDSLRSDERYGTTIAGVKQEQRVMREKVLTEYPE
jgi:tetratricopeptide (TPR) repeat protein